MSSAETDIIIPVWNNPAETRECLAALVAHSVDFRLILLDIGSDQATQQLLHEFAEFLDSRALLLRSENAQGFVATVNRGLARAEAPLMVVMRSTTRVSAGWLEPFQEASLRPDAGILVPCLDPIGITPANKQRNPDVGALLAAPQSGRASAAPTIDMLNCRRTTTLSSIKRPEGPAGEVHHGSFSALGITRNLFAAIGGFDESLDGDIWCLKDYSRRADRAGFRTLRLAGPTVLYRERIPYGSLERREKMVMESIATYTARWGEEQVFCAFFAPRTDQETLGKAFSTMLRASRRGHHFFVFAPPSVYRMILSASFHLLHDAILVKKLPRIFPLRAGRAAFARLRARYHDICLLTGMDGLLDFEGEKGITFTEFEKSISPAEV
jgi:GT2 family glycosyltransferase